MFEKKVVGGDRRVIEEEECLCIMGCILGWKEGWYGGNGYNGVVRNGMKLEEVGYMIGKGCGKELVMEREVLGRFDYKRVLKVVWVD